jgi:threonine dehydratase
LGLVFVKAERLGPARQRAQTVDPFDDPAIVAGQGTLGLELVDDIADLRCVVTPIGGGGLASGVAIAVKSLLAL